MPVGLGLILLSLIMFAIKRRGHPYVLLAVLPSNIFFPLCVMWYLYDQFFSHQVDKPQALVLAGLSVVSGTVFLASTQLIPEDSGSIGMMAVLATIAAIGFMTAAVRQFRKDKATNNPT